MALPIIGVEFWIATDPVLDFDKDSGDARCKLRVKAQDRVYNRDTKQWENGKSLWANATIWRTMAQNTMDSVVKGDNVVITGKLYTREWEDKNGQKRDSVEIDVIEIGPSLRFRNTPHGAGKAGTEGSATPPPANHTPEPVGASTGAHSAPAVDNDPPF